LGYFSCSSIESIVDVRYHFNVTFDALRRWFIAQCYDSLIVGGMWLIALLILRIPWAPFWAFLGAALQFIPNFGPVLTLIGPSLALLFKEAGWEQFLWLGVAFASIAVIDGLILQPYLMKRQNRVPIWASILAPIALGIVLPFWGVLLAPPLLAVIYAHRRNRPPDAMRSGQGIVLPPERISPRTGPRQ
jgi:predicted PurR-regulated permease PerM